MLSTVLRTIRAIYRIGPSITRRTIYIYIYNSIYLYNYSYTKGNTYRYSYIPLPYYLRAKNDK